MRKYIGLENYDDASSMLFESPEIDGIIIGAPFCSHKMFRYGESDMLDYAHTICLANKEVIYQTPVYITSRNFNSVTSLIAYFHDKCQVKKYLVQDVGLVCWIRERYTDVDLIWSHWGRNRNSLMNHDFINFLICLGIAGIETDIPERIQKICKAGLPVYAVYGNTSYNTLSRECYNSYMLNRFDGMCQRECLHEKMSLCNQNFSMTIEGHILGKKIRYPDSEVFSKAAMDNSENIIIYASNYQMAINALKRLDVSLSNQRKVGN